MPRFVLTGAPGTGKTTVLAVLAEHYRTVPEPARIVIAERRRAGEPNLDGRPETFVEALLERSLRDYSAVDGTSVTVFDRALPDCVVYAEISGLDAMAMRARVEPYRYEPVVFIARPWRAIYTTDDMRKATFEHVVDFDTHVVGVYTDLGYQLVELPEGSATERAALIMDTIESSR